MGPTIVIALVWKRIDEITALRATASEASDVTVAGWSLARKRLTTVFLTVETIMGQDTFLYIRIHVQLQEYLICLFFGLVFPIKRQK